MSTWALIGLSIALLIAGFNIGYDCRHFFYKKYKYWICCYYCVDGVGSVGSWAFTFPEEMTSRQLKAFREQQIENMKNEFKTSDVRFVIIDFKRLKD
jgi:hypothetical protein